MRPRPGRTALLLAAPAVAAAVWLAGAARAMVDEPPPPPASLSAQVADGKQVYGRACAACHGAELQGAAGPALAGPGFQKSWLTGARSVRELHDVIAQTMPLNAPASLPAADDLAVTAYLLSANGASAGTAPLTRDGLARPLAKAAASAAPAAAERAAALPAAPVPGPDARPPKGQGPTDAEFLTVRPADWLTYNRNLAGDRFSPLAEITAANAARLEPKCLLQLGELGSFETSPVVQDGRMYLTTAHKTFAVDAATCRTLWSHTYTAADPEHLPGNRGVALYRGRVYRGTPDGHLLALDALDGRLLWDVKVAEGATGSIISGAPVAYGGKVFVGDAGADTGIRGKIFAFDAATGRSLWTFDLVPTGHQPGADTWGPKGAEHGGGATWSSMAVDPRRGLLLVPTGNPAPDFYDEDRPGANLYTDSVVALGLSTGRLAWYVQQVPHDVHDWDTAAAPAIYERAGRSYMAVSSKNGLLYIYDRSSRRTLAASPFTKRENVDAPLQLGKPVHVCPGALGQYNGPAYAPDLNLLFVGAAVRCSTLTKGLPHYTPGQVYFGGSFRSDPPSATSGSVRAFDAVTGKPAWSYDSPSMIAAAVTPTAGGVVFTGQADGWFLALDARTGQVLYRFMTGGPVAGGVSVYAAGGREYVAVASGSSSRDVSSATAAATLVVFGLR